MNDVSIYHLLLDAQPDEATLHASPLALNLERVDAKGTVLSVETDQSGLIGLMRHLHARGYVFLSVERETLTVVPR